MGTTSAVGTVAWSPGTRTWASPRCPRARRPQVDHQRDYDPLSWATWALFNMASLWPYHIHMCMHAYLMVLAVNRSKKMIIHAFRLRPQTFMILVHHQTSSFSSHFFLWFVPRLVFL